MILRFIEILLPILTMIAIGFYCKQRKLVDDNAIVKIKVLLNEIVIPLLLFNSFIKVNYNLKTFLMIIIITLSMTLAFLLANLCKGFFLKDYNKYFPELMTTWEGGTIGLSLCSLLLSDYGLQNMAIFDFGSAIFLFCILLPELQAKDGGKTNVKEVLKTLCTSKIFIMIVLASVCSILGLNKLITTNNVVYVLYHGIVDIVISPINFFIIFMVGYSININKKMLKPVMVTCFARLIFFGIACIFSCFFIFRIVPYDKRLLAILLIAYSLPQSYSLPLFSDFGDKPMQEFVSTTMSFMTIITLILFVFISFITI